MFLGLTFNTVQFTENVKKPALSKSLNKLLSASFANVVL